MEHRAHWLTHNECESWMRELGYETNGKPDWDRLRRDAKVGTVKDVIKQRWESGAPGIRAKIRAALEAAEAKRKTPTATGGRIMGIEEWHKLGETLVHDRAVFSVQLAKMREIAEEVGRVANAEQTIADAKERIARSMSEPLSVLGSVTPAPPDEPPPPTKKPPKNEHARRPANR